MGGRVQNEDMAPTNGQFNTGNEKDTLFPRVGKEVLIEGHPVMIGDGNNVKAGIGCF